MRRMSCTGLLNVSPCAFTPVYYFRWTDAAAPSLRTLLLTRDVASSSMEQWWMFNPSVDQSRHLRDIACKLRGITNNATVSIIR